MLDVPHNFHWIIASGGEYSEIITRVLKKSTTGAGVTQYNARISHVLGFSFSVLLLTHEWRKGKKDRKMEVIGFKSIRVYKKTALLGGRNISPLNHIHPCLSAQLHGCPKPKQHYTCLHWPRHIIHFKLNLNHYRSMNNSIIWQKKQMQCLTCLPLLEPIVVQMVMKQRMQKENGRWGGLERRGLEWRTSQAWKSNVHKGILSELHKCK